MLDELPTILNVSHNKEINKIPDLQEVRDAILDPNRNITTGLDNMIGAFFGDTWDIIKEDVYKMVVDFFCGYELPKFDTHKSVLLPKNLGVNTFF